MEVEAVNGRANSRLAATKKTDDTNSSTIVPEQLMFLLIIGRQYTAMYSIYTMYVYIYIHIVYNDAGHVHVYIPIIIYICVPVSMSF